MSAILTRRQENIWRKKMIERERTIIRYFSDPKRSCENPDGSFCMSAFKDGYYLGRKKQREEK